MKSLLRLATLAQMNTIALSFTAQSSSRGLAAIGSRYVPSPTSRFMSSTPPDTSVVDTCTKKIMAALETDDVKVIGAYDDPNGSHISIEVKSALFEGKRPVQRQQLVYKALWDELQGPVHAVDSMICKTPEE
mmetsp:Transcript_4639/g.7145  ORF Transcript_4639/g.7145 Transcript_4639/m.7145 type:complete len:132 (+) Transcript_4639:45-440(+)